MNADAPPVFHKSASFSRDVSPSHSVYDFAALESQIMQLEESLHFSVVEYDDSTENCNTISPNYSYFNELKPCLEADHDDKDAMFIKRNQPPFMNYDQQLEEQSSTVLPSIAFQDSANSLLTSSSSPTLDDEVDHTEHSKLTTKTSTSPYPISPFSSALQQKERQKEHQKELRSAQQQLKLKQDRAQEEELQLRQQQLLFEQQQKEYQKLLEKQQKEYQIQLQQHEKLLAELRNKKNRASIHFSLHKKVEFGYGFFIVGNLPELGNWNPDKCIPLNWTKGDLWLANVNDIYLDADMNIEYKYIIKNDSIHKVVWESGLNHDISVKISQGEKLKDGSEKNDDNVFKIHDEWGAGRGSSSSKTCVLRIASPPSPPQPPPTPPPPPPPPPSSVPQASLINNISVSPPLSSKDSSQLKFNDTVTPDMSKDPSYLKFSGSANFAPTSSKTLLAKSPYLLRRNNKQNDHSASTSSGLGIGGSVGVRMGRVMSSCSNDSSTGAGQVPTVYGVQDSLKGVYDVKPFWSFKNQLDNIGSSINVQFSVECDTEYGDTVYVVGNLPELGQWKKEKAPKMKCVSSIVDGAKVRKWLLDVELPLSTVQFEYKYLIWKSSGQRQWEFNSDQIRTAMPWIMKLSNGNSVVYDDKWEQIQIIFSMFYPTKEGEAMYVTGDPKEIGSWFDPGPTKMSLGEKVLLETDVEGQKWQLAVHMPLSKAKFQYRYIVMSDDHKKALWEREPNRIANLTDTIAYNNIVELRDVNFVGGMDFDFCPPNMFIGPYPQNPADIDLMKEKGVTAVLNVQTDQDFVHRQIDWGMLSKHYKQVGIEAVRFPIVDFNRNSLIQNLMGAVQVLDKLIQRNLNVYIHCTAGMGRAPAVSVAYLCWVNGWKLEDAIGHVKYHRKVAVPNQPALEEALKTPYQPP